MSGCIKYFDNCGKRMSFKIKDNSVLIIYNEIWNKIEKTLTKKIHSTPVHDKKCIKTKVKEFNGVVNTSFLD